MLYLYLLLNNAPISSGYRALNDRSVREKLICKDDHGLELLSWKFKEELTANEENLRTTGIWVKI
jgi:hypothetical protein